MWFIFFFVLNKGNIWFILFSISLSRSQWKECLSPTLSLIHVFLLPYGHYPKFLLLGMMKISSEVAGTISNKANSKDEGLAFVAGATGRVGSRTVRL